MLFHSVELDCLFFAQLLLFKHKHVFPISVNKMKKKEKNTYS